MHLRFFKKLFAIACVVILLAAITPRLNVSAQFDLTEEDNISAGILGSFSGSGAYDINPLDWFENTIEDLADEPVFKKPEDIYDFLYMQVKEKPRSVALRRTFEKRGLTEGEVKKLLEGQDISYIKAQLPVISKTSSTYHDPRVDKEVPIPLTDSAHDVLAYIFGPFVKMFGGDPETLSKKFAKGDIFHPEIIVRAFEIISRDFALESEIAQLEAELESETVITEIFADGDEGNSGFDLLVDLEVIDLLLFGEPVTLAGISGPGNPPGANEIAIGAFAQQPQQEEQTPSEGGAGDAPAAGGGAGEAGEGQAGGTRGPSGGADGRPSRPFTPIECYADSNFDQRIQNYNQANGIPEPEEREAREEQAREEGSRREGARAEVGMEEAAVTGEESASAAEGFQDVLTPKPAANWRRDIFCPASDVWCFRIQTKYKRESAFPPEASCIACHIEKINDAYMKTVRSNLVPSKATGNLIEIPACKKGWGFPTALNFNFVAISQPILTPPNDNIVVKDVFIGNVEKFMRSYFAPDMKPWGLNEEGKMQEDADKAAADRATAQKTGRSSVTNAAAEINQEVVARRQEALEELKKAQTLGRSEGQLRLYKALSSEVDQMSAFFKSYQELFNNIIIPESGPCPALLNKAACE